MPRNSNGLLVTAWSLFVVSLFLPAVDRDMAGWRCAATCATMIADLKESRGIYYFVFTIPNLLMLLSPILVYRMNRSSSKMNWLKGIALCSALYVLAFGFINWFSPGFELRLGYYLWLVSFWLLFFGLISRKRGIHSNHTPQLRSDEASEPAF